MTSGPRGETPAELVTVGRAAALTGLSPKAVRLYERKGLLPEAERTESGYRLFTADDLAVLHFIRQAKTLDLTLDEIKDVLDLQRCGEQPCGRVIGILDAHIAEIDRKLADLRRLRRSLLAARRAAGTARRGGHDAVVCQIIENAPAEPVRA
ncbi:MAG: MerR family DNA-binding protein [Pseudonocardia sp.]|jgi:MerR family copper efflux transcriptional regulator|uniref:MerR family DNA-binding protein n=1 Tax=Pseudonocardia sp. TaxID=60912 RepID=UPI001AC2E5D4|nr:MerR family DNA-binding protein [Pseudonocardia sp.]MBN9103095.1 MerR family DNA-binding protein [Pseudonocardia sp.]